jgi:hypothetical protein
VIYDKYKVLISWLAACNGTGDAELNRRVQSGEVPRDDAAMIRMFVCAEKVNGKLDALNEKLDSIQ